MEKKIETKSLCKWEKEEIKKNIRTIYTLTADPRYVCQKCARVANLKANVCKPHKFDLRPQTAPTLQ